MKNIQEIAGFCKGILDDFLRDKGLFIAVFLAILASFGLGRLSALEASKQPISIRQAASAAAAVRMELGGQYVASRGGSVYYFPWCGGAGAIDSQNQIWFKSEEAARRAGYSPAKNCKGLGTK